MNGTINLKKLSTKILDAISTLNTRVDAVPSQIKTNNRQMLATVEQNAEASSRAYATGEYLAVNGKLYKALNNIAEGAVLQENVNIEWVLLGDEVSKLRGDLKAGAYNEVINGWDRQIAGGVLDARLGPTIKTKMDLADTLNTKVTTLESKWVHQYIPNIVAINTSGSASNKDPGTIGHNSSRWLTFPITKPGYTLAGVLGYFITGTNFFAEFSVYYMQPAQDGVIMALHMGPNGTITSPIYGSFNLLWKKNN